MGDVKEEIRTTIEMMVDLSNYIKSILEHPVLYTNKQEEIDKLAKEIKIVELYLKESVRILEKSKEDMSEFMKTRDELVSLFKELALILHMELNFDEGETSSCGGQASRKKANKSWRRTFGSFGKKIKSSTYYCCCRKKS